VLLLGLVAEKVNNNQSSDVRCMAGRILFELIATDETLIE
jgi:hypothetical protein